MNQPNSIQDPAARAPLGDFHRGTDAGQVAPPPPLNVWTADALGSISPDTAFPPSNHASTPSHSAALLYAVMR